MVIMAYKMLSSAAIVNCFQKAGIVLQDNWERETESEIDVEVRIWQHICQAVSWG
jgi:hypothetical protein